MLRRWTSTNVGEKRFIGQAPFLAHRDPAATVVVIGRVPRIETAAFDADPAPVFRRVNAVNALSVRASNDVTHGAAAALLRFFPQQNVRDQVAFSTAITQAPPQREVRMFYRRTFDDEQTAESLASQIACVRVHGVRNFTALEM